MSVNKQHHEATLHSLKGWSVGMSDLEVKTLDSSFYSISNMKGTVALLSQTPGNEGKNEVQRNC